MNIKEKDILMNGVLSIRAVNNSMSLDEAIIASRDESSSASAFGFRYKGKNVITLDGLRATARAISTGGVYIRGIAFGTGGSDSSDLLSPIPPSITDTSLGSEAFRITLSPSVVTYSDTTPVSVTFSTLATASDYADSDIEYINEAGLVLNTSKEETLDLFSRITFPSIPFASLASPTISNLVEYTIFVDANSASLFNT